MPTRLPGAPCQGYRPGISPLETPLPYPPCAQSATSAEQTATRSIAPSTGKRTRRIVGMCLHVGHSSIGGCLYEASQRSTSPKRAPSGSLGRERPSFAMGVTPHCGFPAGRQDALNGQ